MTSSSYALSKKKALERIFVFQAVEYGYLTQEQLKECIDEHEQSDQTSVPLLTICKNKGYLKGSQVSHLMSRRLDSSVARAFMDYQREQSQAEPPQEGEIQPPAPAKPIPVGEAAPPPVDIPTLAMISRSELDRILEREKKQRDFLQRKVEELEEETRRFQQVKQSMETQKTQEISTLESQLSCYQSLNEEVSHQNQELQQRLEEKEAMLIRERQKAQSFFNLVDQSGKELREAEERRSKAEGDLQKKYREIEFIQEKLEKESKEKTSLKEQLEENQESLRKNSYELKKLREEQENLQKSLEDLSQKPQEKVAVPEGHDFQELTRKLAKKDMLEAQLKKEQEELQKEYGALREKHAQAEREKEESVEKLYKEKKQLEEQLEREKSAKEEEVHKLRVSLETDLDQYKQKSEQLAGKLQRYEDSLKNWDELEKQKKDLNRQVKEEQDLRKKAEVEKMKSLEQAARLQKEIESIRQMAFSGELESGSSLLGSKGEYYVIQKMLGRGGMGITYSAERSSDGTIVVVKTLLPEAMRDLKVLMRFVQEAHTILGFDHENLVKGYDVYQSPNFSYFVMEFLDGESVEGMLEQRAFIEPAEATGIVLGISRALEYMEKHHLVHRDVKPANIQINSDGVAKLLDFGIVKMTDRTCSLTTEGIILGTPYYLSPEQTYETNVDIRSDIYSLGATYYHMVVGDVPFTGDNPIDVIQKRLVKSPKPGREKPDLPKDVCNVIEKMMNRNIKKRHETAAELVKELEYVYKKLSR